MHIGSTAVPNLSAKPIINIQVGVPDLSAFDPAPLGHAGIEFVANITCDDPPTWHTSPDTGWSKAYSCLIQNGTRKAQMHIRQISAPNQRFALLFREY